MFVGLILYLNFMITNMWSESMFAPMTPEKCRLSVMVAVVCQMLGFEVDSLLTEAK
jgi:hypothetical protein